MNPSIHYLASTTKLFLHIHISLSLTTLLIYQPFQSLNVPRPFLPGAFELAIPSDGKQVKSSSSRASTEICAPCNPEQAVPTQPERALCAGDLRAAVASTASHLGPGWLLEGLLMVYFSALQQRSFTVFIVTEWKNCFGQLPDRIF